jgi:putative hydrolase of the HAD superfamily
MVQNEELRVVLFDVGGVLVENSGISTMIAWMGGNVSQEELFKKWLTSPAIRSFETGMTTAPAFADQLIAEMALPVCRDMFLEEFTRWPSRLFTGAIDLVQRIPKRYTRATLSNTNLLHWPRIMEEMHLAEAFDYHFPSHLTGKIKPDEEAFRFVINALKCSAPEVLFLDDSRLNVEAARSYGINAVQLDGIAAAERALEEFGVI